MGFAASATCKPAGTTQPGRGLRPPPFDGNQPFEDGEQAWLWTVGALRARDDGARSGRGSVPRPCDPDDVIRCLDQLYRRRRIDLAHARVLHLWGERQMAPDGASRQGAMLWREALDRLESLLRSKGIVAEIGKQSLTRAGMPA